MSVKRAENKVLVVEKPGKEEEIYPWNPDTAKKFELCGQDVAYLEEGQVVFIDLTAFSLEDPLLDEE